MTCPRIFVSSTFYDLKHVREIIRKFILDQGYEPVLSEFSDVFYKPSDTVQNSCLKEVSNCDLFVLIIGKRYGAPFPGVSLSITHKEYLEAQNVGTPIYSFVDIDVLHDYEFYLKNDRSTTFQFRVVQEKEVFDLIDEVQRASKDNSLIPYSSIDDILQHLKKQWAKLLKSFLVSQKIMTPEKESVLLKGFEEFSEKLSIVGISNVTLEDVTGSSTFIEMIEKIGGTITDNITDLRIKLNGKTLNIGKQVIDILSQEFKAVKSGT